MTEDPAKKLQVDRELALQLQEVETASVDNTFENTSLGDTQLWRMPELLFYVVGYCSVEGASASQSRVRQCLGWHPSCNFCQEKRSLGGK